MSSAASGSIVMSTDATISIATSGERRKACAAVELWQGCLDRHAHGGVADVKLLWLVHATLETGLWPMEALNPMRRVKYCLLF